MRQRGETKAANVADWRHLRTFFGESCWCNQSSKHGVFVGRMEWPFIMNVDHYFILCVRRITAIIPKEAQCFGLRTLFVVLNSRRIFDLELRPDGTNEESVFWQHMLHLLYHNVLCILNMVWICVNIIEYSDKPWRSFRSACNADEPHCSYHKSNKQPTE